MVPPRIVQHGQVKLLTAIPQYQRHVAR